MDYDQRPLRRLSGSRAARIDVVARFKALCAKLGCTGIVTNTVHHDSPEEMGRYLVDYKCRFWYKRTFLLEDHVEVSDDPYRDVGHIDAAFKRMARTLRSAIAKGSFCPYY